MPYWTAFLLGLLLAGCGPVFSPFLIEQKPEDRKMIDSEWENMFTPPNRLDRDLLLDVLTARQELQLAFDRMHVNAEKYFAGGRAVLEADFDRANPDTDQLTITLFDLQGRTTRRERYGRQEIKARWDDLDHPPMVRLKAKDGLAVPETPEEKKRRLEAEKRAARIQAATQPAEVR